MRCYYIVLAVLISVLFFGCKKDSPSEISPEVDTSTIIPLKVGNLWNYTSHEGYTDSTHVSRTEITKDTIVAGEKWFLMGDTYCTNRSDGYWVLINHDSSIYQKNQTLEFKYPAKAGDSYYEGGVDGFKWTVESINKVVTVPAGTFTCYHYHSDWSFYPYSFTLDYYIAPGIGPIQVNFNGNSSGNDSHSLSLISYTLK